MCAVTGAAELLLKIALDSMTHKSNFVNFKLS